tara:strand:- start:785 stop:1039 length:255 start_codon:yes stop_codon:yes gene_type:complete
VATPPYLKQETMKNKFAKARKEWRDYYTLNDLEYEIMWEHEPKHSDVHTICYLHNFEELKFVQLWSDNIGGFDVYKFDKSVKKG